MSADWSQLHIDTRVRGSDGFTMCKYVYVHSQESYVQFATKVGLDPDKDIMFWSRSDLLRGPLIQFLKSFASDTFAVSYYINTIDWDKNPDSKSSTTFLVGFRDPRDAFKFTLKMPGVSRTKWWKSDAKFVVLGRVGDDFNAHKAERWNSEDPHNMIR